VNDNASLWYEYLPSVILSINTAVHSAIRDTPFFLFHGRDFLPPNERVLQRQVLGIMEDPKPFNILASSITLSREVAKHYLHKAAEQRAETQTEKSKQKPIKAGDRCYLDVTPLRTHKFANPFKGPMRIVKIMTPQTVAIREADKPYQTPFIVRTSRLKREPIIKDDELDRALPRFSSESSQRHSDHKLMQPIEAHSQQQTVGEPVLPTKENKRKQSGLTPAPTATTHKYWLRSAAGN
jgi:hypothetical protein